MIKWLKQNRVEVLVIFSIIFLASFLRFYRLSEYMTFLGDEGRDALVIKNILIDHNIPSLGPPTSVGNIYLGPLYYYMMAPPMAVSWLNPVAPVVMVAFIGVLTVMLVYYLARVWFGFLPAALAGSLYAISSVNIIYSRSSWNPNPAPFFALLAMVSFYKARQNKNFLWLILTGASIAAAMQMHYLAMILIPTFGLLWLYELFLKRQGQEYRFFIWGTAGAIASFLLLMLPLFLFDFKHNWMNFRAMSDLFGGQGGAVSANIFSGFAQVPGIYFNKLAGRYIAGGNLSVGVVLGLIVALPLAVALKQKLKKGPVLWIWIALGSWLLVGLLGLSFYKQAIYDHYLGFMNPAPFILLGGSVYFLKAKWQFGAVVLLLIILGTLNLQNNPLLQPPNSQLQRTQQIARFVIEQAKGESFNFALIAKNNYDAAYQYYLGLYGHKPKVVPLEVTSQLFVVCEDEVCKPIGHPKYEIAGFGWALIDQQWNAFGLKIYRLVENPEGRKVLR